MYDCAGAIWTARSCFCTHGQEYNRHDGKEFEQSKATLFLTVKKCDKLSNLMAVPISSTSYTDGGVDDDGGERRLDVAQDVQRIE